MKKTFLSLCSIALLITACSKNDGSGGAGGDIADAYVGNWLVTDTTVERGFSSIDTTINTQTGAISKTGATSILLNDFLPYSCNRVNATVSVTSIATIRDSICDGVDFPAGLVATKNGNTITFSYSTTITGQYGRTVKGKAQKQP